jgi:cytochrome c5
MGLVLSAIFVGSLGAHAFDSQGSATPALGTERNVWAGVYTAEQAKSGKTTYAERCATCHEGGDQMAPPLAGDDFLGNWENKNLRALYSRIISTMPADNPGTLSEKTVLDIVACLLELNRFPPGSKALETADELRSIKLTLEK